MLILSMCHVSSPVTQKLVDDSLITEVLVYRLFTQRSYRSQHSDTVPRLCLLTASASGGVEAVTLAKVRI